MNTNRIKSIVLDKKIQLAILVGITLIFTITGILNKALYNTEVTQAITLISWLFLSLSNALVYVAFIVVGEKPNMSALIMIASSIITVIIDIIIEKNATIAFENNGMILMVAILALFVRYIIAKRKDKKLEFKKFLVSGKLLKLNISTKIILISMMFSTVFILQRSESFEIFNNELLKFYGALTVAIPIYYLLSIIVSVDIVIAVYIAKVLMEILSVSISMRSHNFNIVAIIEIVIEVLIAVYWIARHRMLNTSVNATGKSKKGRKHK